MKTRKLKELIKIFEDSNLKSLEIKSLFCSVKMDKQGLDAAAFVSAPKESLAASEVLPQAEKESKIIDFNDLTEIKSPMVGVFYSSASPDAKPFVQKGTKVKAGDVICIIEAMKVMNEITSDYDGEIVDTCAENGQLVEFSQVMFKLKQK